MHTLEAFLEFDPTAFFSVIVIDLVLSGDNAIIIGMAAAGLPPVQRRRAIVFGIGMATLLRILFASVTYQLLSVLGLTLAGGILLLWVAYRMWREFHTGNTASAQPGSETKSKPVKSLRGALITIVVADVSMSLDNILAVAGAAHGYPSMLVFGLVLSVALMGIAANLVAGLLERYRWISYIGIFVITIVAVDMIWRGSQEVMSNTNLGF